MKVNLIIACFVILLSSCSKSDDNTPTEKTYSNTNGTSIAITGPSWIASVGYNYYKPDSVICSLIVNYQLRGTINGDSIRIKSIRNEVTVYESVSLDAKKYFTHGSAIMEARVLQENIPAGEFTKDIEVIVYKGADSLKVAFNSGPMRFK